MENAKCCTIPKERPRYHLELTEEQALLLLAVLGQMGLTEAEEAVRRSFYVENLPIDGGSVYSIYNPLWNTLRTAGAI